MRSPLVRREDWTWATIRRLVDEKDHDKFLSKLPDLEKEAEVIGVALESVGDGSRES